MNPYLVSIVIFQLILSVCDSTETIPTTEKINSRESSYKNECSNDSLHDNCDKSKLGPSNQNTKFFQQQDNPSQLHMRINKIDKLNEDQAKLSNLDISTVDTGTLRQVLILHRHGDRTPITFPPKDTLSKEPFWAFHGYGQLTNRGKARLYLLGKLMRKRYNSFFGDSVNKNQRISRASGSLRCIESAQTFLSSFLGLDVEGSVDASRLVWDSKNNSLAQLWQPANVQSVPAKLDGMLAESAVCENLDNEFENVIDSLEESKKIFADYIYEGKVLNIVLGFEMDHFYKWFWAASQIEVEGSYFPDKMNPEILSVYDRVQEAGVRAMGAYQSTKTSKRLRSGLLINNMIEAMKTMQTLHMKGEANDSANLKKLVHYAAHDLTLVSILGLFDSWYKFQLKPDYGSSIVIELHQDGDEWFVKLFFMPRVPSDLREIHIDACEVNHPTKRCRLDKFEQLMQPYRIENWQQWNLECNNNLRSLNPYEIGT